MDEIYSFIPLVATVINLFLTALIYFKNINNPVNRSFAYWSLALVFWNLGAYMAFSAVDENSAWIGCYINASGLVFIPSTFYHFVLNITKNEELWRKKFKFYSFILSFVFLFLSLFTKSFFSNITHHPWGWLPEISVAGIFYLPLLLFCAYDGLYLIWKRRTILKGMERNQLSYVFFGSVVGYIGGTISILTTLGIVFYPISYLFNILFVAIIAYAILVYRLMDVATVLRKSLSYIILSAIILSVYISVGYFYNQVFGSSVHLPIAILFMVGASCFTLFIVLSLRERIEKGLGRLIFAGRYNYQEMLQSLGKVFATTIDFNDLCSVIVSTLAETVGVEKTALILLDRSEGEYRGRSAFGMPKETIEKVRFKKDSEIVKYMASGRAFFKDEMWRNRELNGVARDEELKKKLEMMGANLCLPIMGKDGLMGILAFDKKRSGHIYTYEDMTILNNLCYQIAISVENSKLFYGQREIMRQLIQSEKMVTVGQLTAGIVHDIRNPLSVISGRAQLLMREKIPADVINDLKIINEQSNRINDIINSLLKLSKSSELKFEEIDINDVVNEAVKFVEKQKFMGGIVIVANLSHSLPKITGDSVQLEQVFFNLINNAREAMPDGGQLNIITRFSDANVEIEFSDTGEGIKSDNVKKIFQPFFTTKEKGVGLGLFMVSNIISVHGGKIDVHSTPGKGTTFTIRFPVFLDYEMKERTKGSLKTKKEIISKRRKIRVLAVDDDKNITSILNKYCTDLGLSTDVATKGKDALHKIETGLHDIVILDINMPDINGIEVLKKIKEKKPHIKVIMLSGISDEVTARKSLEYGALDYVKKPLDFDVLEKSIVAAVSTLKN